MLAHSEVGRTNNNCGVEGGWNGVKKEVCGTAGSTTSLAVRSVVPSLLRFLSNKSKEEASFWRKDTKSRNKSMMFSFPSIPVPTKEEWNHVQSLRSNSLELCTVFARPDLKASWGSHIHDMLEAAEEESVLDSAAHVQIRALFNKNHTARHRLARISRTSLCRHRVYSIKSTQKGRCQLQIVLRPCMTT